MSTEKKVNVKQKGKVIATRKVSMGDVVSARALLSSIENGSESVKRFSLFARTQHVVLLATVIILGITGLSQTFSDIPLVLTFIQLMGGITRLQFVHHIFSAVLGALIVLHLFSVLESHFVKLRPGNMLFDRSDLKNIAKMIGIMVGTNHKLPRFDRYKTDEKFMYWVTAFSVLVSLATGLFMLFPVQATFVLPGSVFPFFISIHRWQAILLAVVVVFLHTYQVLRKKDQVNIWTGAITVEEMRTEHPVELEWLERIARLDDSISYPVHISLGQADVVPAAPEPVVEEGSAAEAEVTPEIEEEIPSEETHEEAIPSEDSSEKQEEINVTDNVKIVTSDEKNELENNQKVKDDSTIAFNQKLILEESDSPEPETPPTTVDEDQDNGFSEKVD